MVYKKKVAVLSGVIAALAVIYILSIVFDPQRVSARSNLYSWLDPALNNQISGITIQRPEGDPNGSISLKRNGDRWFVSNNGVDYPARQTRIDDFLSVLTKKAEYPVRSSSAASHERLMLTGDGSARIIVSDMAAAGGTGLPLLNLILGQADAAGQIFLRKDGENEARSGENIFAPYTTSEVKSWYNLRLFPETESGSLTAAGVQRVTIYPPAENGEEVPVRIISREGGGWTFNFAVENPDMKKVDTYVQNLIDTAGDDFADAQTVTDPFTNSRIVLELGDGSIKTVKLGEPDSDGRRYAMVTGADWIYALPFWASPRLLADASTFAGETAEESVTEN